MASGEFEGHRRPSGHLSVPGHPRCPTYHEPQTGTIDLTSEPGEVLT